MPLAQPGHQLKQASQQRDYRLDVITTGSLAVLHKRSFGTSYLSRCLQYRGDKGQHVIPYHGDTGDDR